MSDAVSLPAPTPEEAAASIDRARSKAAVHLELLSELLAVKALDPRSTSKTIQDAAEFNYKLSGLAAKQTAVAPAANFRVSFNFNARRPGQATIDVTPEPDVLANPPGYIDLLGEAEELVNAP